MDLDIISKLSKQVCFLSLRLRGFWMTTGERVLNGDDIKKMKNYKRIILILLLAIIVVSGGTDLALAKQDSANNGPSRGSGVISYSYEKRTENEDTMEHTKVSIDVSIYIFGGILGIGGIGGLVANHSRKKKKKSTHHRSISF